MCSNAWPKLPKPDSPVSKIGWFTGKTYERLLRTDPVGVSALLDCSGVSRPPRMPSITIETKEEQKLGLRLEFGIKTHKKVNWFAQLELDTLNRPRSSVYKAWKVLPRKKPRPNTTYMMNSNSNLVSTSKPDSLVFLAKLPKSDLENVSIFKLLQLPRLELKLCALYFCFDCPDDSLIIDTSKQHLASSSCHFHALFWIFNET